MSSSDSDLNNTIIENQETEQRSRTGKRKNRTVSISSRSSSASSLKNWLKQDTEEDKKRKANESPEGKNTKKKSTEEDKKMGEQETVMKMLEKKWKEEEKEKRAKDAEESERWSKLYENIKKGNEGLQEKLNKLEKKFEDEIKSMKREIEGIKKENKLKGKNMNENDKKTQKLAEELEKLEKETSDKLKELEDKIEKKQEELEASTLENPSNPGEKTKKELRWLVEDSERERKKKNIIVSGTEIKDKDTLEKWIDEKLGVKVAVRKIWILRNIKGAIGAQIETNEQKTSIMKNKKKLRQEKERIFINNDTTWLERRSKEEVKRKADELKNQGRNCKISHNKIITDQEEMFWNERQERWFRKEKKRGSGEDQ